MGYCHPFELEIPSFPLPISFCLFVFSTLVSSISSIKHCKSPLSIIQSGFKLYNCSGRSGLEKAKYSSVPGNSK
ncbi:hypothetical protein BYT27DRAFT_6528290 [Phlegmacium glaucopus]|nr:hypothetical protein BYT27DRAFT_6528290 [Phlegmacium glaucopus]